MYYKVWGMCSLTLFLWLWLNAGFAEPTTLCRGFGKTNAEYKSWKYLISFDIKFECYLPTKVTILPVVSLFIPSIYSMVKWCWQNNFPGIKELITQTGMAWQRLAGNGGKWHGQPDIEGILRKGSYLPCVSMAGRALFAGYHWYTDPKWRYTASSQ